MGYLCERKNYSKITSISYGLIEFSKSTVFEVKVKWIRKHLLSEGDIWVKWRNIKEREEADGEGWVKRVIEANRKNLNNKENKIIVMWNEGVKQE